MIEMRNDAKIREAGSILPLAAVVVFLVGLAACTTSPIGPSPSGIPATATAMGVGSSTATATAEQNWVIFPEGEAKTTQIASWLGGVGGFWTPSEEDVLRVEGALAEYLRQNSNLFYRQPPVWERLDAYQRQYFGLERGGRRIIYGNYFCTSGSKNWRRELVIVLDGGDCYFQVEYDVDIESFTSLWVNGEA